MEETERFFVLDDEGGEIECEVLFCHEVDEGGRQYVIYTDHCMTEDGCKKIYAAIHEPDVDERALLPVETEREWAMIESLLEDLRAELDKPDTEDDEDVEF